MTNTTSPSDQFDELPVAMPPVNHGHTSAAWIMVFIIIAGVAVSTVSFIAAQYTFVYIGLAVSAVGILIGVTMARLGHGKKEIDRIPERTVIEKFVPEAE